MLSLPISLRLLLAAQPQLLTPVLQVVHRVLTRHLPEQAGLKTDEADSGTVTLIQRFGSSGLTELQPGAVRAARPRAEAAGVGCVRRLQARAKAVGLPM